MMAYAVLVQQLVALIRDVPLCLAAEADRQAQPRRRLLEGVDLHLGCEVTGTSARLYSQQKQVQGHSVVSGVNHLRCGAQLPGEFHRDPAD